MKLKRSNIGVIDKQSGVISPDEKVFLLPEKVLQFGTGVLLRGLPDYFIDKANRSGIFNGRIVVVKSTSSGDTNDFDQQDCLYTICVKGIENDEIVEQRIINSSISRVLTAKDQWHEVLECAARVEMQLIISNTTEVGITYTEERINENEAPVSFPGKLLAFLYERFRIFGGTKESGMVIIPTELITDNGSKLRSIVLKLAEYNKYPRAFTEWILFSNDFCDSLVDRIVPGRLPDTERIKEEQRLGYTDELMIMTESFRLWAIQSSSERVRKILSFAQSDNGVIIAPDINKFRELKLRLLNGTHSFTCAVAFLSGFSTVKEAMNDESVSTFVKNIMFEEIVPAITDKNISGQDATEFAERVIDRFCNPFLDHKWSGIAVQYTSKMKMRNVPLILSYYQRTGIIPELMCFGFAAYLIYMRCITRDNSFIGNANGTEYKINDDNASYFAKAWANHDIDLLVDNVMMDAELWEVRLSEVDGFSEKIKKNIRQILSHGTLPALKILQKEKVKL